jgi:hypothetical protein
MGLFTFLIALCRNKGLIFEKSPNNNSTMGNKSGFVVDDQNPMSNFIEHQVKNS